MSVSLQYEHVSQFYETVLFFLLPLLTIQSITLCASGLNSRYQDIKLIQFENWEDFADKQQQQEQESQQPLEKQGQEDIPQTRRPTLPLDENTNGQNLQQNEISKVQQKPRRNSGGSNKSNRSSHSNKSNKSDKSNDSKSQHSQDLGEQDGNKLPKAKIKDMISMEKARRQIDQLNRKSQSLQNVSQIPKDDNQLEDKNDEAEQDIPQPNQNRIVLAIKYCTRIDEIFDIYIPTICCILVLGILSQSVYIFSMFCFFGFCFSTLLFNYADVYTKLKQGIEQSSWFARINYLLAGTFTLVIFISYWIDTEFKE